MIARQETFNSKDAVWSALAAPVPVGTISWRQDGKPVARDGRHFARFVCYIEANTVRERLEVYHKQTKPLIDYYRAHGKLRVIDGELPIDEVKHSINEIVEDARPNVAAS